MDTNQISIIPQPVSFKLGAGTFTLNSQTAVSTDDANAENGRYLHSLYSLSPEAMANKIELTLDATLVELGEEGYRLQVEADRVEIVAKTTTGVFYGIQTLCQLLPVGSKSGELPCVQIEDKPRFSWRGFMLDEGRHFHGKETVMRLLDAMALLKMNRFHWHLTEDQGWRIEIKKYPRLTEIGSTREGTAQGWLDVIRNKHNGVPHHGFYTQEDIREVVAYAAARHITVIPEIEMPGHSSAALAAYPHLGCTGGPYNVPTRFGIFKDVYCVGKEETFAFFQDVLTEVMDLFPGKYIHIGGDEAPRARWKQCPDCQRRIAKEGLGDEHGLQLYLTNRMARYLAENGRILIGWNEILNDDLDPSAVAQYWIRNKKGLIAAIENGRNVILSPNWYYYLDYNYNLTSLSKTYHHEPIFKELSEQAIPNVLGIEAPLWTEFVPNRERVGYQAFPRLTAVAETAWTPQSKKNYDSFRHHLPNFIAQLETLGLQSAPLTEVDPSKLKQKLGIFTIFKP